MPDEKRHFVDGQWKWEHDNTRTSAGVPEVIDYEGRARARFQLLFDTTVSVGCYATGAGI
jgi:hypothetical protein